MNIQTIFQAGNSQVVSIPKALFDELELKLGQKVIIDKVDDSLIIKKVPTKKNSKNKSTADFQKWLEVFLEENGEILDELAER